MAIDTIVLDFGGVLLDWNPRYLYRSYFDDEQRMEWFLAHVCTSEWNAEQDRGRPLAEAVRLLSERFPEWSPMIERYYGEWERMLGGPVEGMPQLVEELHGRYPLYGLTNWSAQTLPLALARFPFMGLLDGMVVSGEERLLKPDERIYRRLLSRFGLRAERCLFIDDNPDNVAAAARLGFRSLRFTGAQALRRELPGLGVGA